MAASSSSGGGFFANNEGPIEGKNQFRGVLFKYGPNPIQVAFKQVTISNKYLEPLAIALDNEKWSLVQLLMSSSYNGYGTSSLQQDAMELDQLISYLINKENSEGVVLLGHSTGCQDIVHYMRTTAACSRAVRAAILQVAPIPSISSSSDREYRATLPETAAMIDLASSDKGRYNSLCAYMGDDDMFSSDLNDHQLKMRLDTCLTLLARLSFSMDDEYVPEYVDKKALVERLCRAMGVQRKLKSNTGTLPLYRAREAVQAIIDFVKREGPNGWDDP
ncbi:basic 7S globulin-like [Hibiscus syriacus]|uniref:Basic 7S globulin-like n=1 Tax=Hibiscus syriacus TaxID=106335 RepID=A0A6A2ZLB9_HIBSY|nr:basic 7S globulin-like [Hibiscus syriacus]